MAPSLTALLAAAAAVRLAAAETQTAKHLVVPLTRGLDLAAYYAELSVGTPPQKSRLLADTGSPTFSFEDPSNSWCETSGKPCAYYGTFDNLTSTTCRYNGSGFFDELADFGSGDFLTDTVSLGGVSTPDLYFGYINEYPFTDQVRDPTSPILGLGLDCYNGSCDEFGPFLLPQLKNASTIDRIAVSAYLGPDEIDAPAEMVLGGAYDRAKLGGEQFTLPMVDPFSQTANKQTNNVNITAITVTVNNKTQTEKYGSGSYSDGLITIIDTGNSNWGLTPSLFNLTVSAWEGFTYNDSSQNQVVDCKYASPQNNPGEITVQFGPAGSITVPIHRLVTPLRDGTCATFLEQGLDESSNLGDPFIRSTYAIWDQEAFTITLAPVKYTTASDIVPFPAGGFPVTKTW